MSKAFTREDAGGDEPLPPYEVPWPPGARNYVTPAGHAALRAEQAQLAQTPSPSREVRRRLAVIAAHLEAAEVIEPPHGPVEQVQFGTTVTVRDESGQERRYSIVGVDETGAGRVSWLSPIARALQGARVGETVTVRTPRGEEEWTIEAIAGA